MAVIGLVLASLLWWGSLPPITRARPVFVTASFLDKNHLYLENLSREEVRVFENGQPRQVEYLASKDVPFVYGLLFDREVLPQPFEEPGRGAYGVSTATAASNVAYQLLDQAFGQQAGWMGFYDADLQVAIDFVQDNGRIKDAIQMLRGRRTLEEPSLYAALFTVAKKMSQRNEKRRVLVLFVEVLDTKTGDKLRPLKNLLSASNLELFVASFGRSRIISDHGLPPAQSEASLSELAGATAGAAYSSFQDSIEGMGRRISYQIKSFYTIGFQAESETDAPGKLRIECTRPNIKVTSHPVVPILQ